MAKFSEETLNSYRLPPSNAEETKLQNAERLVREAISEDAKLSTKNIQIFGQGSYANDTNVRLNSDIDINVRYMGAYYYDLPEGATEANYGLGTTSTYSYAEFRRDVENALVNKFSRREVTNNDKCLTIEECDTRVEADVVPTFNYRLYRSTTNITEGVKFISNKGSIIRNFPLQHIENGKQKNSRTQKRFKRLTRIFRRIRYKMMDDGIAVNENITSFLIECLVYNVPDRIMNGYDTWTDRLKESIRHIYHATKDEESCKSWTEVSEELYLFYGRKWSQQDVNAFILQMWHYLDF